MACQFDSDPLILRTGDDGANVIPFFVTDCFIRMLSWLWKRDWKWKSMLVRAVMAASK